MRAVEADGGTRRERAARTTTGLAVVSGLLSIAQLVQWGNRWYVTEMFARDAGTTGGVSWEWLYGSLHGALDALVGALACLVATLVLAGVAWWLRRKPR